jgi:hypothetical protein
MRYGAIVLWIVGAGMYLQEPNDFVHVMTALTVEQADSAVTAAFRSVGLKISKNTQFSIEANDTGRPGFSKAKVQRLLTATISVGDSTGVFIVGEEARFDRTGFMTGRRRVNDRDKGDNAKFWQKVLTVAKVVDSTAHARPR